MFAAFAAVARRAQTIQRFGDRAMRFNRKRSVRHRRGGKAFENVARRFDLVERNRLAARDGEVIGNFAFGIFARRRDKIAIGCVRRAKISVERARRANGGVQQLNDARIVRVMLAFFFEFEESVIA